MGVITLTTDWGYRDFYVSALKGTILSQAPETQIVDITHSVEANNSLDAAFIFKQSFQYFPDGTVHIIGVGSPGLEGKYLVVKYKNQFLIGADEGIFSLVMNENPQAMIELEVAENRNSSFISQKVFVPAAIHLLKGGDINKLGKPADKFVEKVFLEPVIEGNTIRASIIYIDEFENLIVNVSRKFFDNVRKGRNFVIHFRKFEYNEDKITEGYDSVSEGEKLIFFNSFNLMEIAVNRGKAASLLGLHLRDTVRIEFNDSTFG